MILTHALRNGRASHKRSFRYKRRRKKRRPFVEMIDPPNTERRDLLIGAAGMAGSIILISGAGVAVIKLLLPPGTVTKVIQLAQTSPAAPLIYGVAAVILPTVFVSQTLMTLSAGALFGTMQGTILSITSQTLSAMIAYGIGTQLARRTRFGESLTRRVEPYIGRLRQNAFEGMLLMRLLYIPQEMVSYASGMLNVGWKPLIFGTALGSLPATFFLVQVGAGISGGILGTATYFNPALFTVSGGVFAASFVLARYMRAEQIDDADVIEGEIIEEMLAIE